MSSSAHRRDCTRKQEIRSSAIKSLPSDYHGPFTEFDSKVHDLSLAELVKGCHEDDIAPEEVLLAYGKKALAAQAATNCLAEIMFRKSIPASAPDQPLLGVPVSIKECIDMEGIDTTIGYSSRAHHPSKRSAPIIRLLRDAGAILHVKSTVPIGLFGCETFSDLYGYTSNPYNPDFACGASTGGGAALLGYKGSMIELGTDIGGSVRLPAHWCGVVGMKSSEGRFPGYACASSVAGLEGVPIATCPMATNVEDLEEFWKRVMSLEPWNYDSTCIPLPWRNITLDGKKLRWGVIWTDGITPPSPACTRALSWVVEALRKDGHEVVDFTPPDILEGLKIAFPIIFSDGANQIVNPLRSSESIEPAVRALHSTFGLPRFVKNVISWFVGRFTSDAIGASILKVLHPPTVLQERELIVKRDEYRQRWLDRWNEEELDFVLTVPHPLPAIPRGTTEKVTLSSTSYTFLWNVLDQTAGVIPITHVDKSTDALPADFSTEGMCAAAQGAYSVYDVDKMDGLPLGVQIVGRRWEEEKVLKGMAVVQDAMKAVGRSFVRRLF